MITLQHAQIISARVSVLAGFLIPPGVQDEGRAKCSKKIFHPVAGATLEAVALAGILATANTLTAGNLYVPNGSFESPATVFVDTNINSWQKSPQPPWYDPNANGPWDQLTGVFLNTPPDSTNNDHIVNLDGSQAAFLFALPGVALFQDGSLNPNTQFTNSYRPGRLYDFSVGVLGNGGGMSNGATLQISFYYRGASSNVTIAATTVTNSSALFPDRKHLVDFKVRVPSVAVSDPWAGKEIGVQIASTTDFSLVGGYWDIDNVRLTESIAVPNYSFESPATAFVDTNIDYWQKSPKPVWYNESTNGPWAQLTGVFLNPPPDSTNNDHIVNCDGAQAAFLFALPSVALSQDNITTSNAFNVSFETGKSYLLTVGVLGNGGGMTNGVTLQIGLYYRDAASNVVSVASTTITNSNALFPNRTNLVDFQAQVPPVKATDPWAGKNIGVQIVSAVDFSLAGGYWDVDNVRLESFQAPVLNGAVATNGQFNISLLSEPGLSFALLASSNVVSGVSNWVSVATVTNTTGNLTLTDPAPRSPQRFYQAKQLP
jgi:hypothetical protein